MLAVIASASLCSCLTRILYTSDGSGFLRRFFFGFRVDILLHTFQMAAVRHMYFCLDIIHLCVQEHADAVLRGVLSSASIPVPLSDLEARKKALNSERKVLAKEIAKEKRKRKLILEKTRALTEDEMAREIVNRRLRAAAKDSSASASNRVIE